MGRPSVSSSSSIDSSSHPNYSVSSSSSASSSKIDLSTDLRLGLSISSSSSRDHEQPNWPPIKRSMRNTLAEKGSNRPTFYVKVYLDGIPIGRKLDLFAHNGYLNLIRTLSHMFLTTIIYPGVDRVHSDHEDYHVLTYEDKEGDWMMVGDVPWDMFLTTVKRLKITRSNQC
ncbi:hypothetical protein MKW98_003457 [Papaver atlanticum]|uniref:Auxin-responsive protein n=1 Tax=Papaver atlanticum TaxID=357466 RepID=A0AAD4T8J5_9MAGN|nr:hypothetical protein MKW98_003457 [Papaver atlanticum]